MNDIRRALRFFAPDRGKIALVLLLLVAGVGANLLKPWPLAVIIDSVLGTKPLPEWLAKNGPSSPAGLLALLSLAVLGAYVGQGMLAAFKDYLAISVGLGGLRRVRNEAFNCLQRLSLRFHHGSKSGDLLFRAAWDTYSFQTLFQQGLMISLGAGVSLVAMLVVMYQVNHRLTWVAVATVPMLFLVIRVFGKKMTERGAVAQQADSSVTSLVQQSINALPLIQSYTREDHEEAKFTAQTETAQKQRLDQHKWELAYWFAITTVFGAGTAGIVWLGGTEVQAGRLTVGEMWIFVTYLGLLYEPLNQLSHVGATLATAKAGTRRVFEILDSKEMVQERADARPVIRPGATGEANAAASAPLTVRGDIVFEQVAFGYDAQRQILQGISFRLKPGESAALIGPSGVGKSTLMNLLPRFYDPTGGTVRLDGADLRDLRLRDLRQQIAVVLQEPILLPTTILENIAYGRPGASREDIERAAKLANADAFIRKLPQGYETNVGDGAARLSVGERQRLNLARAFLKDAPILLLDEPTSALDAESESLVVASLHELMKGRTTLMVAHRLSTIRRVNQILVLQEGRVIESGTHDELVARNGYYTRVAGGQVALD